MAGKGYNRSLPVDCSQKSKSAQLETWQVQVPYCDYLYSREAGKSLAAEAEAHILIHSLQDANLPKFLAEDVALFESIMADLFPGVNPPKVDHGALEVSNKSLTTGFTSRCTPLEKSLTLTVRS